MLIVAKTELFLLLLLFAGSAFNHSVRVGKMYELNALVLIASSGKYSMLIANHRANAFIFQVMFPSTLLGTVERWTLDEDNL